MLKYSLNFFALGKKKKKKLKSQNFITIHVGVSDGTLPQVTNKKQTSFTF